MSVNVKKLRLLCIISALCFSLSSFSQLVSGVVQGDIDVKKVRVSINSQPLKKISKRGYFSIKKADLEKDTLFFYEDETSAPYYYGNNEKTVAGDFYILRWYDFNSKRSRSNGRADCIGSCI